MSATDARYGRRGGRWTPGSTAREAIVVLDEWRAAQAAKASLEDGPDDDGAQLALFAEEG